MHGATCSPSIRCSARSRRRTPTRPPIIPLHPGAAAFYNGTQESFLDKWGNIIFLAPMIAGALASVLAAAWKFLRAGEPLTREQALDALYALGGRIRASTGVAELDEIEREIDRLLLAQRKMETFGEQGARDVVAVNVAAHRLENLIHDRRLALASQQEGEPRQHGLQAEPRNSFDLCQTSGILAAGWSPRQLAWRRRCLVAARYCLRWRS